MTCCQRDSSVCSRLLSILIALPWVLHWVELVARISDFKRRRFRNTSWTVEASLSLTKDVHVSGNFMKPTSWRMRLMQSRSDRGHSSSTMSIKSLFSSTAHKKQGNSSTKTHTHTHTQARLGELGRCQTCKASHNVWVLVRAHQGFDLSRCRFVQVLVQSLHRYRSACSHAILHSCVSQSRAGGNVQFRQGGKKRNGATCLLAFLQGPHYVLLYL